MREKCAQCGKELSRFEPKALKDFKFYCMNCYHMIKNKEYLEWAIGKILEPDKEVGFFKEK